MSMFRKPADKTLLPPRFAAAHSAREGIVGLINASTEEHVHIEVERELVIVYIRVPEGEHSEWHNASMPDQRLHDLRLHIQRGGDEQC